MAIPLKKTVRFPLSALASWKASCAAEHFGEWMIDERWLSAAVASIQHGLAQGQAEETLRPGDGKQTAPAQADGDDGPGDVIKCDGWCIVGKVGVIQMAGAMMKGRSKFGGCSTIAARHALREAQDDDRVHSILLVIDSPGGTMAGTKQLADDVAAATKPVYAHCEDNCCSAAYYVASQCRRITATPSSLIGSLGTILKLEDSSGAAEKAGIKVLNITNRGAKFKGAGAPGTEITKEHLAYFQQVTDDLNAHFMEAVMRGRKLSVKQTEELFDGRVHEGETAKALGLIDGIQGLDETMAGLCAQANDESALPAGDKGGGGKKERMENGHAASEGGDETQEQAMTREQLMKDHAEMYQQIVTEAEAKGKAEASAVLTSEELKKIAAFEKSAKDSGESVQKQATEIADLTAKLQIAEGKIAALETEKAASQKAAQNAARKAEVLAQIPVLLKGNKFANAIGKLATQRAEDEAFDAKALTALVTEKTDEYTAAMSDGVDEKHMGLDMPGAGATGQGTETGSTTGDGAAGKAPSLKDALR
jgi:signal peptide peptidase SppA